MSVPVQTVIAVAGRVLMRSGYLHMMDLLRGLAARGCKVCLLCSRLQSEFQSHDVPFPVHTWEEVAGRWPALGGEAALREFVLREKAQIIHVHGTGLGFTGNRLLKSVRVPIVFTPHSASEDLRAVRRMQGHAVKVIALSEYLREGLVNRGRVPREKVNVIPLGVEVERYEIFLPQFENHAPLVGTISPLEAGRGQADFLHAVKLILNSGREVEFMVAGDGPTERSLRRQAAALGIEKRLTFVTRVSSYRDVMCAVDVFVRPGVRGGIGHTVLEAMAMGKPAVTIASASMLEIVAEEVSGFMVPKGDIPAMAAAIERLIDDPSLAREMGLAARRHVAKNFSMDQLIKNVLRIYSEAVGCERR